MADTAKEVSNGGTLISDLKSLFSVFRTRRSMFFAYGFMVTFVVCTAFFAFSPSTNSSPWFSNIFGGSSSDSTHRSQFSSLFSYFFPNSSRPIYSPAHPPPFLQGNLNFSTSHNTTTSQLPREKPVLNTTASQIPKEKPVLNTTASQIPKEKPVLNTTASQLPKEKPVQTGKNGSEIGKPISPTPRSEPESTKEVPKNRTETNTTIPAPQSPSGKKTGSVPSGSSGKEVPAKNGTAKGISGQPKTTNLTAFLSKRNNGSSEVSSGKQGKENLLGSLMHCNIFDGNWVRDDSYPLYPPGSCPHIDEPFNCFLNSRPDGDYQKLRWQPKGCNIPRLNGKDMLELLRGKRLVFVGDSLNRNMWESLVCILRNSVKDKRKVFEASGRREFRTEGSYSFVFKDYNCSVEFFRSPFLVQEWEMPDTNGSKKETLRLDIIERSSDKYKGADVIVFNTGHWWTHEKTAKGKDYYQEGSHIYGELNVVEAFRKALTTWARWVDANINSKKTLVFFRGYSASHFSGGRWNSGGQCDHETEPIKNETYLAPYPPKMAVLESVMKGMKTPVSYLNITRMTDYRKDAHPSIYRKQSLTVEERRSPLRYQDCSHWCLPGVPDSWNELLYAQLLIKHNQKQQQQQQKRP